MSDPVRVVVAEGPSSRKGLLRFVLEGEGYDVVGDAATSAELARAVAVHRPDVVVMDDAIGSMAVGLVREILPSTRVILVWPGAVVPIGGDARVEPSEVLRELGRTMERLTGQPSTTTLGGPLHITETETGARQDAATLREILARGESAQLQHHQQPARTGGAAARAGAEVIDDRDPAPVVILPVATSIDARADEDEALGAESAGIVVVPDLDLTLAMATGGSPAPVVEVGGEMPTVGGVGSVDGGLPGVVGRRDAHGDTDHGVTHRHGHKR